jgi:hypothetical protein
MAIKRADFVVMRNLVSGNVWRLRIAGSLKEEILVMWAVWTGLPRSSIVKELPERALPLHIEHQAVVFTCCRSEHLLFDNSLD